jgi:hypothetical protein
MMKCYLMNIYVMWFLSTFIFLRAALCLCLSTLYNFTSVSTWYTECTHKYNDWMFRHTTRINIFAIFYAFMHFPPALFHSFVRSWGTIIYFFYDKLGSSFIYALLFNSIECVSSCTLNQLSHALVASFPNENSFQEKYNEIYDG